MPKKKKVTNGNHNDKLPLEEELKRVIEKRERGEILTPEDLDAFLRAAAEEMRAKVKESTDISPIQYVADALGIDVTAANSYFFTSYGVFQKDIQDKVNPYVAYTVALIHALNLGFSLGGIKKDEQHTASTTSKPKKATRKRK